MPYRANSAVAVFKPTEYAALKGREPLWSPSLTMEFMPVLFSFFRSSRSDELTAIRCDTSIAYV